MTKKSETTPKQRKTVTLPKGDKGDDLAALLAKTGDATTEAGPVKKPVFLDRVMQMTSVKKREAKPAIEAAMQVLADALEKGEELNLPPLGKLKVVKSKTTPGGAKVLTVKLRTRPATPKPDPFPPLAEDGEEG